MPIRSRHLCTLAAAVVLTLTAPSAVASAAGQTSSEDLREVLFVGNNWDGTADVIESGGDFGRVGRINVIPDKDRRMAEINANPIRWIYFMGIRNTVGEGHDQFVDDMYSTPDGTAVVVSRPSFADVVSLDLATGRVNWRFPVSGYRSDHMAVSPTAGVAVSASTSNTARPGHRDRRGGRQVQDRRQAARERLHPRRPLHLEHVHRRGEQRPGRALAGLHEG